MAKEVVRGEKMDPAVKVSHERDGKRIPGSDVESRLALDGEKCPWHLSEATRIGPGEPSS